MIPIIFCIKGKSYIILKDDKLLSSFIFLLCFVQRYIKNPAKGGVKQKRMKKLLFFL
jgi:hypothetical protein